MEGVDDDAGKVEFGGRSDNLLRSTAESLKVLRGSGNLWERVDGLRCATLSLILGIEEAVPIEGDPSSVDVDSFASLRLRTAWSMARMIRHGGRA